MTQLYSVRTRPDTDAERDTCIAFVVRLSEGTVDPRYAATVYSVALPAISTHQAADRANIDASVQVTLDTDAVRTCATALDTAIDTWTTALDRTNGRRWSVRELPQYLRHLSLSAFKVLAVRVKLDTIGDVLARAAKVPQLVGEAAVLDELRAATVALGAAVDAQEASERAWTRASAAAVAATSAFDKAYGKLVKDLLFFDEGGVGADVPRFRHRVPPAEDTQPTET